MIRYIFTAVTVGAAGYIAGLIFGYRAAVVDYVENDARTIRKMADTMYDTASADELPDEVKQALDDAEAEASGNDRPTGFQ